VMMVALLIGVIVSYVAAAISFLDDTPLSLGSVANAVVLAAVMGFISLVPNIGYLSKFSLVGLFVLFTTILVIAAYGCIGLRREGEEGGVGETITVDGVTISTAENSAITKAGLRNDSAAWTYDEEDAVIIIPPWPESLDGVCSWFGIVVFGYGVVPLTYNYRESMTQPTAMVGATTVALGAVSCLYVATGIGLLLLFPDLTGDVLHELPRSGVLPVFTRLSMVWVILMTAPLLIVPCGELLEGKWQFSTQKQRVVTRFGIMSICVVIAILVPAFVKVLSLVGCGCVGAVSLILPPLLHLRLSTAAATTAVGSVAVPHQHDNSGRIRLSQYFDKTLLAAGIAATVISTLLSLKG